MNLADYKDVLGRLGHNTDAIISKVEKTKKRELREISLAMLAVTTTDEPEENNVFKFNANSALSGKGMPCSQIDCRISKIEELATFSALYADHVYVQNPFEQFKYSPSFNVNEFLFAIQVTKYLEPLIKAGLVSFTDQAPSVCYHCWEKIYSMDVKELKENVGNLNKQLETEFLKTCSVQLTKSKTRYGLEITGPESLLAHGGMVLTSESLKKFPDKWVPILDNELPYSLKKQDIRSLGVYQNSIQKMVSELVPLELTSKYFGSNALIDNPLQLNLVADSNRANPSVFSNAIKHSLPAILDIKLTELVKFRKNETDAFAVYRDNLQNLIKQSGGWKDKEVKEAFADTVRPEINKINKAVTDWRKSTNHSIKNSAIASALVGAGAYMGIIPLGLSKLAATGVSGKCLPDIVSLFTKDPPVARANANYFLWKIAKK